MKNIQVILLKSRFPENVGMVARAVANMGAGGISLVKPELWNMEKARPLATAKGQHILENITIEPDLDQALASHALVVGTSARTGGWRREILHPSKAAKEISVALKHNESVALLMGPEDKGLNNEEITYCQRLVSIPTAEAASLNVAQATLLMLYECFKTFHAPKNMPNSSNVTANTTDTFNEETADIDEHERRISSADEKRLMENLKETLMHIDFLHQNNPDYFFMPLRRLFGRAGLRRHEYDALMGICRQIKNKCK